MNMLYISPEKSKYAVAGSFKANENKIYLHNINEFNAPFTISHEFMHYLLFNKVSLNVSNKYDSDVGAEVDGYQGCSNVEKLKENRRSLERSLKRISFADWHDRNNITPKLRFCCGCVLIFTASQSFGVWSFWGSGFIFIIGMMYLLSAIREG